jgi:hypothetical protein
MLRNSSPFYRKRVKSKVKTQNLKPKPQNPNAKAQNSIRFPLPIYPCRRAKISRERNYFQHY